MKCLLCHGEFTPRRSDAAYCSTACRVAANQALKAMGVWPPGPNTSWTHSAERERATGRGVLQAWEAYRKKQLLRKLVAYVYSLLLLRP